MVTTTHLFYSLSVQLSHLATNSSFFGTRGLKIAIQNQSSISHVFSLSLSFPLSFFPSSLSLCRVSPLRSPFFNCVSSGCLRVRFTVCPGVRVSLLLLCRAEDFSALPSRNLGGYLVVCCAALDLLLGVSGR